MKNATECQAPMILANREGLEAKIRSWMGDQFKDKPYLIVCVSESKEPSIAAFNHAGEKQFTRALVVMEGIPINISVVGAWREWAMGLGVWDLRMAFIEKEADELSFKRVIEQSCADWNEEKVEHERCEIKVEGYVKMPGRLTSKDDSSLLTMMFGSMGELLTRIEVAARQFKQACDQGLAKKDKIEIYLAAIDKQLGAEKGKKVDPPKPLGIEHMTDHFPKLLLYGESGVGKTLVASYLQSRTGLVGGRPRRIPIPEYLGKEDMFEYDLFGYARGAYTDGREEGDHGLLLGHTGGVIFLDEIGEANPTIQAKLLAFLDDYKVRPRGWGGEPFYCPVLIVAATNKDLEARAKKGKFAKDLLNRFTDSLTVPPLRDRMEDIKFILDCLLQRDSLNPGQRVKEIGEGALERIKARDYQDGNFRELEDLFRLACHKAIRNGRHNLVAGDFP
jgi:hypothetical protein